MALPGTIWGISTFYNPAGYGNKLLNYRKFHDGLKRQGLPLLTVELAFGDNPFELQTSDADILLQFRTTSVLWHKERMFNAALKGLPQECDKIVWLDADILFQDEEWVTKTRKLLEEFVIIQPFSHVIRFPKGVEKPSPAEIEQIRVNKPDYHGYVYSHKTPGRSLKLMNSGLAWAGRREVFDQLGFYDKLILGTGDRFMAGAFFGFRYIDDIQRFNYKMIDDQNRWILDIYGKIQGSVYYQDGIIGHLFHGTIRNRKYHKRTHLLKKYDFDPLADIGPDHEGGIWKWTTQKTAFHQEVEAYFSSRKEEDNDHLFIRARDFLTRKALALKSRLYHLQLKLK